ncbi:hypothetical protein BDU57DRAFT_511589 [Ampelomyces quisqualis]|uniref:Mmc1 C-terminal domain-containing protein n=1 Tax=Ampelomyces quisqualis TaxID=50730 RepID=A0A6A5QST1_AMPQU|nr:hypothetical protein BDU57DRAFT_511589 [Ampelomyces quisqualis]
MPPRWGAAVPRLSRRVTGRAREGCGRASKTRSASTQVAPTAIHLRPDIASPRKELHDALAALGGVAQHHANRRRLQLALEGVAARDAVTRVAVLGLTSQASAQRLTRLLLADALGAEERWEQELAGAGAGSESAVLLKYGDDADADPPHAASPLFRVRAVPARLLRCHNLEILVAPLDATAAAPESPHEAVHVPRLLPVHKTLVFAEGLDSALAFARFTPHGAAALRRVAKLAVDLPPPSSEQEPGAQDGAAAVNTQAAAQALAAFRASIQNATAYERGWFRSGLPALSSWLVQGLGPATPIQPVLKTLVSSVVDDIEASVAREDAAQSQKLAALPSAQGASASIVRHLETWAEKSHAELRDQLDTAFTTRNWHKLAWWKLFWRVDDVTMISTQILERRWLTSAEKSSIFLAGRMNQAGFPDEVQPGPTVDKPATTAENTRMDISTDVRKSIPWPEHIAAARTDLINDLVPPLQALAQRLVLQTFSTTSLSSAASALLYLTMSNFSVFEASAVGVLGLTISLRRMQKLWEGARESWEGTVREEGRRTLKGTEEAVRMVIRNKERLDAGLVAGEDEGVVERRRVREAVGKVREALERIDQKKDV